MEVGKQFSGLANLFDRFFFHQSCYPERWQEFLTILTARDPNAMDDADELRAALKEEQKEVKDMQVLIYEYLIVMMIARLILILIDKLLKLM